MRRFELSRHIAKWHVDGYKQGELLFEAAVRGVVRAFRDTKPVVGLSTPKQVIGHYVSEMASAPPLHRTRGSRRSRTIAMEEEVRALAALVRKREKLASEPLWERVSAMLREAGLESTPASVRGICS